MRFPANALEPVIAMNTSMAGEQVALSPKRPRVETSGMADVFPYYAGFSYDWARSQLASLGLNTSSVVLDPWNGSGTTTLAARSIGCRSIGIDLNPVANVVARLRVQVQRNGVSKMQPPDSIIATVDEYDPLLSWFSHRTTLRLRQWMSGICVEPAPSATLATVSLFRVVRRLTINFEGSNPTWVRRADDANDTVDLAKSRLDKLITREQGIIQKRLKVQPTFESPSTLITASATRLPIKNNSIDAILTSPPYLTRIDYAVAYSRELAILGVDVKRDRTLRSKLMGTTLIRPDALDGCQTYCATAQRLVERIAAHPSKASGGYYLKQVRQYLDDLLNSFDELTRVSTKNAAMTLVVQDSYYKDIPVPLAQICVEEAQQRGWKTDGSPITHEVKRFLTQMNTAARVYTKGKVAETVITLRRE